MPVPGANLGLELLDEGAEERQGVGLAPRGRLPRVGAGAREHAADHLADVAGGAELHAEIGLRGHELELFAFEAEPGLGPPPVVLVADVVEIVGEEHHQQDDLGGVERAFLPPGEELLVGSPAGNAEVDHLTAIEELLEDLGEAVAEVHRLPEDLGVSQRHDAAHPRGLLQRVIVVAPPAAIGARRHLVAPRGILLGDVGEEAPAQVRVVAHPPRPVRCPEHEAGSPLEEEEDHHELDEEEAETPPPPTGAGRRGGCGCGITHLDYAAGRASGGVPGGASFGARSTTSKASWRT